MSMGKRRRARQPTMWVTTTDLPTTASHPFYTRLNQLLRDHGFDDFAEGECARFYADTMGRPGLPPGIYFRLLLIEHEVSGDLKQPGLQLAISGRGDRRPAHPQEHILRQITRRLGLADRPAEVL